MSDAWRPVFSVDTPWPVVEALVEEYAQSTIDDLRAQLDADVDLTPSERIAMMDRATPLIRQQTRVAFETGWQRLQEERSGTTFH